MWRSSVLHVNGKCKRQKGCKALNNHTGPCYDKKGKTLPKWKPIQVIRTGK